MSLTRITLVLAVDEHYFLGALVTLASALLNLDRGYSLHIHVIDCGKFPAGDLREALQSVQGASYTLEISQPDLKDLRDSRLFTQHLTRAALASILLPRLLPHEDKALFLDADVIVNGNLGELWQTDLQGYGLAAVLDPSERVLGNDIRNWQALNLDAEAPYFNSGVLLLSLEYWRQQGMENTLLRLMNDPTIQRKRNDQSLLNIAFMHRWLALPGHWNQQVVLLEDRIGFIRRKKGILHCVTGMKPWRFEEKGARGVVRLFYDILAQTGSKPQHRPATRYRNPDLTLLNLYVGLRFFLQDRGLDVFRLFRFLKKSHN